MLKMWPSSYCHHLLVTYSDNFSFCHLIEINWWSFQCSRMLSSLLLLLLLLLYFRIRWKRTFWLCVCTRDFEHVYLCTWKINFSVLLHIEMEHTYLLLRRHTAYNITWCTYFLSCCHYQTSNNLSFPFTCVFIFG